MAELENFMTQILKEWWSLVSLAFEANPFLDEEQMRQELREPLDQMMPVSPDDEFHSRLHSHAEAIFDHLWRKHMRSRKRVHVLLDSLLNWYKRDMDAVVNTKNERPSSLTQLTARHKKINSLILISFRKDGFLISISPHRQEFEEKLVEKMTDYFNSIIPHFQTLIEEDIQLLVKTSIESYIQIMGTEVSLFPPATMNGLTQIHDRMVQRLVSQLESEPKIQESREKDQILQQLTSSLSYELMGLEQFLLQKFIVFEGEEWMEERVRESAEAGKRMIPLVDKSFNRYKRDMDAVVQTKEKRPASLTQLTAKHEKIANHIIKKFQKFKAVIVSPHRTEFEEKLVKKMADHFNSIIPHFQKLIEEDILNLVTKSIDSYFQSVDISVDCAQPATVDDLVRRHNGVVQRLVSELESEPKIQDSREKDQILQQLTSCLDHELVVRKIGLEQEIQLREAEKRMDEIVGKVSVFLLTQTSCDLIPMNKLTEAESESLMQESWNNDIALFDMRTEEIELSDSSEEETDEEMDE